MSHDARNDIPSLDGIRALAVGLVFFAHSGLERYIPGGLGVTVFFVLSGYLITTLLSMEYATHGHIDYRNFYLRRFLRLIPPLLVVVALTALLAAFALIEPFSTAGLLSVLFYFGNYFAIANDFNGLPPGMGVMWSLAVEEHYYLLYPPLAALLLKVAKPRASLAALLSLCAAILVWRFVLVMQGVHENHLTMATDTRVDSILIGCVLALWRNPWLQRKTSAPVFDSTRITGRDAAWIFGALGLLLATLAIRHELFRLTVRFSLQSIAVAVLLYYAVARSQAWPFRWLNARPLMYVGVVSYTIYLSHHVILLLIERHRPGWPWWLATAVAIALTLAVAEPVRRFIEQPCARLRKRLHRERARTPRAMPRTLERITGSML